MTDEQRAAAAERLATAREKRAEEDPPQYKNVHPNVLARPDTHYLSIKNIKMWIKHQKDLRYENARAMRKNEKGAISKYMSCDGYIKNMERYLRTSEWVDLFWGMEQENRIQNRCVVISYYDSGPHAGQPKRTVGTYYDDICEVWTREMDIKHFGRNK